MVKLEIKYPDGTILKREFKDVEEAVRWLKEKIKGVKRDGKEEK